jgi:low affinity Fe/Cu permease
MEKRILGYVVRKAGMMLPIVLLIFCPMVLISAACGFAWGDVYWGYFKVWTMVYAGLSVTVSTVVGLWTFCENYTDLLAEWRTQPEPKMPDRKDAA